MKVKALETIKYGQQVANSLPAGELFFFADIQKATGLDTKSLQTALTRMFKNGYITREDGRWCLGGYRV